MVAGPGQRRSHAGRRQRRPGAGAAAGPAPGHPAQRRPADAESRQRRRASLPARSPFRCKLVGSFTERVSRRCTVQSFVLSTFSIYLEAGVSFVPGAQSRKLPLRSVQASKLSPSHMRRRELVIADFLLYFIPCSQDPDSHSWRGTLVRWASQ